MIQREIEIEFNHVYYWTDSKIVLKYIQNEGKRYTVYVGNRVVEIREKSELSQWRYCPSKENPGDDASRGLNPAKLASQSRWLNGPPFLKGAEMTWPATSLGRLTSDDPELIESTQANLLFDVKPFNFDQMLKRYSTWNILKSKVVWLTRFKTHLRNCHLKSCSCLRGKPTLAELQDAEYDIIRIIQRNEYLAEFVALRNGRDKVKVQVAL